MRISLTTFAAFSICRPVHTELFLFVCVLLTALVVVVSVWCLLYWKGEDIQNTLHFLVNDQLDAQLLFRICLFRRSQ